MADPVDDYLVQHSFASAAGGPTTFVEADGAMRSLSPDEQYLVDNGFLDDTSQLMKERREATIAPGWVATSDPVSEAPLG